MSTNVDMAHQMRLSQYLIKHVFMYDLHYEATAQNDGVITISNI